jgi:hypothetical protein
MRRSTQKKRLIVMLQPIHTYEAFEEFFQGLGMSPDEIRTAQESAESDADV